MPLNRVRERASTFFGEVKLTSGEADIEQALTCAINGLGSGELSLLRRAIHAEVDRIERGQDGPGATRKTPLLGTSASGTDSQADLSANVAEFRTIIDRALG